MLGVSPESYRTWDAGRRATPPKMLARARALATHRNDHALLPLPVLALLIGVHVKTLRAAARDGRLPVTYDTRTHLSPPPSPRDSRRGHGVSAVVLWEDGSLSRSSCAIDLGQRARRLRRADSRAASRLRVEPGAIVHPGGRGAEGRRLPVGSTETYAIATVLATNRRASRGRGQPLGNRCSTSRAPTRAPRGLHRKEMVEDLAAGMIRVVGGSGLHFGSGAVSTAIPSRCTWANDRVVHDNPHLVWLLASGTAGALRNLSHSGIAKAAEGVSRQVGEHLPDGRGQFGCRTLAEDSLDPCLKGLKVGVLQVIRRQCE